MARAKATEQQWGHARSLWITTDLSAAKIGKEIGVGESGVRAKATSEGWGPRNAPERKRALVAAAVAGAANESANLAPRSEADAGIMAAANEDIEDMALAISVGRKILMRCASFLDMGDGALDPRELSAVSTTWKTAVEGIRKIRGLDDATKPDPTEGARIVITMPAQES